MHKYKMSYCLYDKLLRKPGSGFFLVLLLFLLDFAGGFMPNSFVSIQSPGSRPHTVITERALYRATAVLFNELAYPEKPIPEPDSVNLTPAKMFQAFYGRKVSTSDYLQAVKTIYDAAADIDFNELTRNDPTWHFDAEQIDRANRNLIRQRMLIYNAAVNEDYVLARELAGNVFHALQDFYSHSNWVEMGNTGPYKILGISQLDMPVAERSTLTCLDCVRDNPNDMLSTYTCTENIADDLRANRVLTSGYHSGLMLDGKEVEKPPQKCSHGGVQDTTQNEAPVGGINKDGNSNSFMYVSPHYGLHSHAAKIAEDATLFFLNGLRESLGKDRFAELLNIKVGRSLSIVMDTTGSMGVYQEAAKQRCIELIDATRNGELNIKNYILMPFNDPAVGPLTKTEDPDVFTDAINSLKADGGGEVPELSLTGLLTAARASEEKSAIFLFTDCHPGDPELFDIVVSTLLARQQTVTFFGKIDCSGHYGTPTDNFDPAVKAIYGEIARITGGHVIMTSAETDSIFDATAWITNSIKSTTVTLVNLDEIKELRKTITFSVDSMLDSVDILVGHDKQSPTIQLPANYPAYQLIIDSPTTKMYRVAQPGSVSNWQFEVTSANPDWYVKVIGQSVTDLSYGFGRLENSAQLAHPGYHMETNNPVVSDRLTLLASASCDGCSLTRAFFRSSSGASLAEYSLTVANENNYLANVTVPKESFYVEFNGLDNDGKPFQRLTSTQTSPTFLQLTAKNGLPTVLQLEAGSTRTLVFTVKNTGEAGKFNFSATDSLAFVAGVTPATLDLTMGQTMEVSVVLSVPTDAKVFAKSDLEMAVGSSSASAYDANFLRARILVVPKVFDETPPICKMISETFFSDCPESCGEEEWSTELDISDQGMGISAFYVNTVGPGNITWSNEKDFIGVVSEDVRILANGSCCLESVDFAVVDFGGLTARCQLSRVKAEAPVETGLSVGAIVGIVIGSIVGVVVIGELAWFGHRQWKLRSTKPAN